MTTLAAYERAVALPPLFARFWSSTGEEISVLAEWGVASAVDPKGGWRCEVRAPGGTWRRGVVGPTSSVDTDVYSIALAILDQPDPARLWLAEVAGNVRDIAISQQANLDLWHVSTEAVRPLELRLDESPRTPHWLIGADIVPPNCFLEIRDHANRPSFVSWRRSDLLAFDTLPNAPDRLTPRVFSPQGLHTAYWSFLRLDWMDAARAVAERLVHKLSKPNSDVPGDQYAALAGAHAIVRFREFWKHEALVRAALGQSDDFDSRLALWILDFEGGLENAVTKGLSSVMARFEREKPTSAEGFRLFYERLAPAIRLAGKRGLPSDDLRAAKGRVDRLASASYWDAEHLVFCGDSPLEPSAQPKTKSVQKKNFAAEILRTLNARSKRTVEPASAPVDVPQVAPARIAARADVPAPVGPSRSRKGGQANERWGASRGRSNRQDHREAVGTDFVDKLVHINRVAKVVKGGRRFGFAALVVIGDKKGHVGYGHGKAREVPEAIRKATDAAKRGMIRVALRDGRTLHHDVDGKWGAGKVILRSAPQGTGIIAGGAMRAVFETLGIQDVVAKSLGSSNPYNLVRATFEALRRETSPRAIAARRGMKVSTLQGRRRDVGSETYASM